MRRNASTHCKKPWNRTGNQEPNRFETEPAGLAIKTEPAEPEPGPYSLNLYQNQFEIGTKLWISRLDWKAIWTDKPACSLDGTAWAVERVVGRQGGPGHPNSSNAGATDAKIQAALRWASSEAVQVYTVANKEQYGGALASPTRRLFYLFVSAGCAHIS